MKIAFAIMGGIAGVIALSWAIEGNDFFLYRFWAPRREAVRREVFENTKSYRQGMIQDLQSMQFEYVKSNPEKRAALRSVILHRSADFPEADMPSDLRDFIHQLRSEQ